MRRRRTLRPEEQEIWNLVAKTARPMHERAPAASAGDPPSDAAADPAGLRAPGAPPAPPAKAAEPFRLGPMSLPKGFRPGALARSPATRVELAPTPAQALAAAPLRMDAGTHKAMKRGRVDPEARLDLHGMTLAEAHPELIRFLMNAQSDGKRLALVITGKGKARDDHGPIPSRMGALRHQLPHWLALPPLRHIVLQATEAHLKHGGGGAWYIYLRRIR